MAPVVVDAGGWRRRPPIAVALDLPVAAAGGLGSAAIHGSRGGGGGGRRSAVTSREMEFGGSNLEMGGEKRRRVGTGN